MKIPTNNLWQRLSDFNGRYDANDLLKTDPIVNRLNQLKAISSEEPKKSLTTSTPIGHKVQNSTNYYNNSVINRVEVIREESEQHISDRIPDHYLSPELSPIIRRKSCRKTIFLAESDEELDSNLVNNENIKGLDKTTVDYYTNNRLIKTECVLSGEDMKELKELNYELMTQICDSIHKHIPENTVNELKGFLEIRTKIVNRMNGTHRTTPMCSVSTRTTGQRFGNVSPDLFERMDPFDDDLDKQINSMDFVVKEDSYSGELVCEVKSSNGVVDSNEVVDLCDDNSCNYDYNSVGNRTPSVCSVIDSDSDPKSVNTPFNSNEIEVISEWEWNNWEEIDENDDQNNGFSANVKDVKTVTDHSIEYDLNKSVDQSDDVFNTSTEGKFVGVYRNDGTDPQLKRTDFSHSRQLDHTFHTFFGLKSFRTNQLEAINAALLKNDCLILMPTGGGKSLCYQLPAIMSDGITIVISPLKSLILDQVQKINDKKYGLAKALTGDMNSSEVNEIYSDLRSDRPKMKLLFVTPEKISASNSLMSLFDELSKKQLLSRFVIDETHCVSQWGHDFRPDYQKLYVLRQTYRSVPIMALTATATQKVRLDVLRQLGIENPSTKWFMQSFNRPNLKFEVRSKTKQTYDEILLLLQTDFRSKSGIIYCLSRKDCDSLATKLTTDGIKVVSYHAGLTDNKRREIQENWIKNKYYVICATIAFGMGIDKADVRFVIHHSMPKSIEGYYQEVGRAGRDGQMSHCILYFSGADFHRWKTLITKSSTNKEMLNVSMNYLYLTEHYCNNKAECRKVQLLRYFGEVFSAENCIKNIRTVCDNCLSKDEYENTDITEIVVAILRSIQQLVGDCGQRRKENISVTKLKEIFSGSEKTEQKYSCLPMFGKGKHLCIIDRERVFKTLICQKYLNEDTSVSKLQSIIVSHSYVRLGESAKDILSNGKRFYFQMKKKSLNNYNQLDFDMSASTSTSTATKRGNPWNSRPIKRFNGNSSGAKSPYFRSQTSKPASKCGFKTDSFISVPIKRKPKKPQL